MCCATSSRRRGVVAIVATLLPLASGLPARAQDAARIVERYVEAATGAQFAGVQQINDQQTDGQRVSVISYTHHRGGRERQKYDNRRGCTGIVLGEQDGYRVVLVPYEKRLYRWRGTATPEQRQDLLRRRMAWFDVSYSGTETIAGRRAYKLSLKPKHGPGPTGTLWVDCEKYVRLALQMRMGDRTVFDSRFQRISYRPIAEDDLRCEVPDDTETIDMPDFGPPRRGGSGQGERPREPEPVNYQSATAFYRATGVRPLVIAKLPEGFRFSFVAHHPPEPESVFRRRVSVHYRRGDQLVLLSMNNLFSGPPSGPLTETPTEIKPKVFLWRRGSVRLACIGPRDVSSAALRTAAESVTWADVD